MDPDRPIDECTKTRARSSPEQMRGTMALLRVLALGERQIEAGRVHSATNGIARLRKRRQTV